MSTRPVLGLALGLGLALTLVLGGCSGDTPAAEDERSEPTPSETPSETPGETPTETATASASGPDPACGGLGVDLVREVLGPEMKAFLEGVDYCVFSGPRQQPPTLIVSAIPTVGDPAQFTRDQQDFCDGDLSVVPDVGDAAWACLSDVTGPQGFVVAGAAFVQLDLTSGDERADLDALLELLPSVVVPSGLSVPE